MKADLPWFYQTLDRMTALLHSVPVEWVGIKPQPEDWSVKEIVGHLIDSASNTHQRFTRSKQLRFIHAEQF